LQSIIGNDQFYILASEELLEEIKNVVLRPKFQKFIKKEHIDLVMEILSKRLDIVEVKSLVQVCRDPKDDFILALCKDGKADFLVTGDNDLLVMKKFENTKIVSLSAFEQLLQIK
jgi:putative PIN family toxin of toxin-antitoxin system